MSTLAERPSNGATVVKKEAVFFADAIELDAVQRLTSEVGKGCFAGILLQILDERFSVVEINGVVAEQPAAGIRPPNLFLDASRIEGCTTRADHYRAHYSSFDAPWQQCLDTAPGQIVVQRTSLSDMGRDGHRRILSGGGVLKERISIAIGGERATLVNLFLAAETPSADQLNKLAGLMAALAAPICAHARHTGIDAGWRAQDALSSVHWRLARLHPSLSSREREVCARTVIGMSAQAIALDLDIGICTVNTYRRRAYERVGISSAYELFGILMKDMFGGGPSQSPMAPALMAAA